LQKVPSVVGPLIVVDNSIIGQTADGIKISNIFG
jgi:hypothetical protein